MNKSFGEIVFGLVVVAVGVGFLLDTLGLADFSSLVGMWWPLGIVLIGVVSFISNPRLFLWPLVIMAIGVLLQVRELGLISFNVWSLIWPTLIIVFGLSILFERSAKRARDMSDNTIGLFAAFSGNNARSTSNNFKGGKVSAIFGGVELDLRDAVAKGVVTLDVFTAFGGAEIRVPQGWLVKVSGLPLFGGWEDKTTMPKDSKHAPVLHIKGTCLFGGVEIKN